MSGRRVELLKRRALRLLDKAKRDLNEGYLRYRCVSYRRSVINLSVKLQAQY
jgi:HEPN domain-containing protein